MDETRHGAGKEVRAAIERIGGTMPNDLPTPAPSIQGVERHEQAQARARLQAPLFSSDKPSDD